MLALTQWRIIIVMLALTQWRIQDLKKGAPNFFW